MKWISQWGWRLILCMVMVTSAAGVKAIKQEEGEVLTAYQDVIGVWTIGVGHTGAAHAFKGNRITPEQSTALLKQDLRDAEQAVNRHVKVPLTQKQFNSLVSIVINIGNGAFARSTLLKKLNQGDYYGAADEFTKWNRAGKKIVAGLIARRARERAMFLSGTAEPGLDSNLEADVPVNPPNRPVQAFAGTSAVGALGIAAESVQPLADYSEYLKILWIILVLSGIGYFIYSQKKGD